MQQINASPVLFKEPTYKSLGYYNLDPGLSTAEYFSFWLNSTKYTREINGIIKTEGLLVVVPSWQLIFLDAQY